MNELRARANLIEVCRLAYTAGYIRGTEGNFSIKISAEIILSTPSGTCKGRLSAGDLVLTDLQGQLVPSELESWRADGGRKPSTELKMHLTAYKLRPDIRAVVHAHPPIAVGFTVAGKSLDQCVLPEVVCSLGIVPVAPYATPSTAEVSQRISELIKHHDAIVLAHHGALTVGSDIWDAFYKLETLERHAQVMLVAEALGGVKTLTSAQVRQLLEIRSVYGFAGPLPPEILTGGKYCQPESEDNF